MGARISVLVLVSLICGSLSGCLFSEDEGEKFDLDVSGVRLLFIIAAILGLGSPILIYLKLWNQLVA